MLPKQRLGEAVLRFIVHRSDVLVAGVLNGIGWCALMPSP